MEPSDEELKRMAERRVRDRYGFVIHATMYAVVNAGLVLIWLFTRSSSPWFVWPLAIWGAALAAHAATLVVGPGSAREQRAIERELHRLHTQH